MYTVHVKIKIILDFCCMQQCNHFIYVGNKNEGDLAKSILLRLPQSPFLCAVSVQTVPCKLHVRTYVNTYIQQTN